MIGGDGQLHIADIAAGCEPIIVMVWNIKDIISNIKKQSQNGYYEGAAIRKSQGKYKFQ